jgi:transposase-like protein
MSKVPSPFRYFHSSPEIIRMAVLLYVRFPLSLRNVEDLLFERHLVDRQTFQDRRSAAWAEWHNLVA